jgi:uncharacterized protein (TIGR02246 family)
MENEEQAIRQLVATWLSASKAGDNEKVLSLMADDVLFLVPGQPPMTKAGFAAAQPGLQAFDLAAKSEIQEIRVFGEWAYMWTQLEIAVTPKEGGAPVKRAGTTLSILKKQNGAWVIYRDANLLAVVPQ